MIVIAKEKKTIKQRVFTVFGVCFIVIGTVYLLFQSASPSHGTVKNPKNSLQYNEIMKKSDALKDVEFVLTKVYEKHPAAFKELPQKLKDAYANATKTISESPTVSDVYDICSAFLSALDDHNTFVFSYPQKGGETGIDSSITAVVDKGNNLGTLTINEFKNDELFCKTLDDFFAEVKRLNISNITLDLRENKGGDIAVFKEFMEYTNLAKYQNFISAKLRWSSFLFDQKPKLQNNKINKNNCFNGKLSVLISKSSSPEALHLATILKENNLALISGEADMECDIFYGDFLNFQLPKSKLILNIPCKKYIRYDTKKEKDPLVPNYSIASTEAME